MKTRVLKELYTLSIGEKSDYRAYLTTQFGIDEQTVNERAKKILIRILHDYSAFSISTIDTFFQQVIRSFAREIGVNGGYNLELDVEETLESAVDTLFQDLSKEENKQLLAWMTRYAEEKVEQAENWNIRGEISSLGMEIFKENYQNKAEETNKKLHDREFLKSYIGNMRKIKKDFENEMMETADKALKIIEANGLNPDDFSRSLMCKTLENLRKKEFEVSETFRKFSEDPANCYAKSKPQHVKSAIETAYYGGLGDTLKRIVEMLNVGIIQYNSADLILKHLNTLGILSDLAMYIKSMTNEQNTMLISDTNMLLSRIIEDSDTPFVYERTGINIDHFMIDEFQDTSVLQWRNFKPLIMNSLAHGQKNMVVGDVKQSIYRWRNSDWKLLQEQLGADFTTEQRQEETLGINWRSDRNIVDFNNSFFHRAALLLQAKFNEAIENVSSVYPYLETLKAKIAGAYKDVTQEVNPKAAEGYVKLEFIPEDENEDGWRQASLERIPQLLESLVDRGYKPSDIAFLVRKNDDAAEITQYLLQYKKSGNAHPGFDYSVIGNEGLMLASSLSVSFIIAVLKVLENPADDVQRTIMNYEYLRGKLKKTDEEAIKICLNEPKENPFQLFTPEENDSLEKLRYSSLYTLTEGLIDTFQLPLWYDEAVFLQAFQDVVYKFVNTRNADLSGFLRWWDKKGNKQNISTPESQQAFRVMTIHKSKGLDFKVVIVLFCDWKLDAAKNRGLMWMQTNEAPFSELPLIPINFSSKLGNTIFAEQYYDELLHQYVDSLNTAYVAFTRARNEMHCFLPLAEEKSKKNKKTDLENLTSLSDVIMKYVELKQQDLTENEPNEISSYELGAPQPAFYPERTEEITGKKLSEYPIVSSAERLQIRHISGDYWKTDQTIAENRLNFGVIMHEILQNIQTRADEEKQIRQLVFSGRINEDEAAIVRQSLDAFWQIPETEKWFPDSGKVFNETAILLPWADQYRPDRVMIADEKATVLDYKFGQEKYPAHSEQIRHYARVLNEMGYAEVEAYLVYVSLGEVVRV